MHINDRPRPVPRLLCQIGRARRATLAFAQTRLPKHLQPLPHTLSSTVLLHFSLFFYSDARQSQDRDLGSPWHEFVASISISTTGEQ